ncbi:MAG: YqzL family protein [Clostridiales bacterium]|nr:YqzL family protein [Clostridiales bacterium]
MKELIWSFFAKTGSITTYLLYKEMDNDGVREENERSYKTSTHQRGGTTLHQL